MSRPAFRWQGQDLHLTLWVQPGARRDALGPPRGQALTLRVAAPAVEGKANQRLVRVLAGAFGVSRRAVSLARGAGGRLKHVIIHRPARLPPEWPLGPPEVTEKQSL